MKILDRLLWRTPSGELSLEGLVLYLLQERQRDAIDTPTSTEVYLFLGTFALPCKVPISFVNLPIRPSVRMYQRDFYRMDYREN